MLSGFFPSAEFEISVEDRYGAVLLRENVTLRDDGGAHPVEFVVVSKPRVILGTVLDHQGRPLAGARVAITHPIPPLAEGAFTDASGKFEIGDVYATEPSLSAYADGHVAKTVAVGNSKEPLTLRLERGRVLMVKVTGVPSGPFGGALTFELGGGETGSRTGAPSASSGSMGCPAVPVRFARPSRGRRRLRPVGPEETEVSIAHP